MCGHCSMHRLASSGPVIFGIITSVISRSTGLPPSLSFASASSPEAASRIRQNATPRIKAAKALVAAFEAGIEFIGDPVPDWRTARKLLDDISSLNELFREARMVRLFRATDEVGSGLADLWLRSEHYGGAKVLVSNTLEHERLISADQEPRGCVLMSMHKSKGKEFDGVVIVEKDYSGVFFDPNREQPPYECTRRLLYVAITRARTHVMIVRPMNAIPLTQHEDVSGASV